MVENRKLLSIFLIVVVDIMGLTIILPLLPFYAEKYGATPTTVGLLVSSYAICQFFSGPLLGQWSDRIGRKPLLLASQFGTFAGFILLAFANSLPLIFLSRIIDGLTAGNISLAQAYISDVTEPKDRAKAFGKIGMAFGIGFFLGPALTGFLYRFGYHAPIFAAAALSATSMVATATLLPAGRQAPEGHRGALFAWGTYLRFFKRPELAALLFQILIFYFSFSAYVSGFALFSERRFLYNGVPFGPKQVGYLLSYFGFLGIVVQGFFMGRLVKALGERKLVILGFLFSLIGYALLGVVHLPIWVIATGFLTSVGASVLRPSLTSEISQKVARNEQGIVHGLNQSLNSIAQVTAPILGTFLIGRGWLTLWAWLSGVLCAGALLLISRQKTEVRL